MKPLTEQLLTSYPIISDQIKRPALSVVMSQFERVLQQNVPGDAVEMGCYIGTTTLFLRRLLNHYDGSQGRTLYAYDSFSGLPKKSTQDASGAGEQFISGELAVSKKQFLHEFQKAHLTPPVTIKNWFSELQPDQLPGSIAFAFLDGDFYSSIIDSLRLVWPRLAEGGVITVDDYQRTALPGVERAVADFFQNKPIDLHHQHNIAVIKRR